VLLAWVDHFMETALYFHRHMAKAPRDSGR
ncbi:hypothetical protein KIPB_011399, partial [Kipferlia bialata]